MSSPSMRLGLTAGVRVAAVAVGVALLASRGSRLTTVTRASRSSTSGTGTPPTVSIDSPLVASLINVGDSVYVRVHVKDDQAVASLELGALTISGDKDLGTYQETPRYTPTTITF